jgi:hypothetical protein
LKYTNDSVVDDHLKYLARQGWEITRGGRHWKVRNPKTNFTMVVSVSASDWRYRHNYFADYRRAERRGFRPVVETRQKEIA